VAADGVESISLAQNEHMNLFTSKDEWLVEHRPDIYMSMLETAELVAGRNGIRREQQDAYAVGSQQRVAAAAPLLRGEIVPLPSRMAATSKETGEVSYRDIVLDLDEGPRPQTGWRIRPSDIAVPCKGRLERASRPLKSGTRAMPGSAASISCTCCRLPPTAARYRPKVSMAPEAALVGFA